MKLSFVSLLPLSKKRVQRHWSSFKEENMDYHSPVELQTLTTGSSSCSGTMHDDIVLQESLPYVLKGLRMKANMDRSDTVHAACFQNCKG